jgi:cyclophilin family peptidyl-prolyl cis-trans isomerase
MLTNLSLLSYSYELSSSVVFGKVLEGEDVVKRIEEQGTSGGTPKSTVTITDCGEL